MTPDFAPEVAKCPQNPQIAFEMIIILCHLAGQSQCHTQPVRHHYNVGFKHSLSNKCSASVLHGWHWICRSWRWRTVIFQVLYFPGLAFSVAPLHD